MPYRVRRIDWRLFTGPASQGINIEAQANAGMARSILGGLVDTGNAIERGTDRKQQDRQFNARLGQQDRQFRARMTLAEREEDRRLSRLAMAQEVIDEKRRERQALATYNTDLVSESAEQMNMMAAAGGGVDEKTKKDFGALVATEGGVGPAIKNQENRQAKANAKQTPAGST